jgi:hypothetical protein
MRGPDRVAGPVARRFSRYDLADHLAVRAPDCAAWLTGQSSYRHSQLSADQLGLLDLLADAGFATVRGGFPFNSGALARPYHPEPLAFACARNAAQYLAARAGVSFRAELARHLQPLLDRTARRLVLLCGSCGLELLAAALPQLRMPPGLEVLVVGLGPVGRVSAAFGADVAMSVRSQVPVRGQVPARSQVSARSTVPVRSQAPGRGVPRPGGPGSLRLHVIRAEGDWISRLGCRRAPDLLVPGGHLGYPRHPGVRAEVARVAREFRR